MNIRKQLDISSYLVVGPENTLGRPVSNIVAAALQGGFTCVQVRSKTASAREMIALLRASAAVIAAADKADKVALLADDRLDVVLAARAQGIKADGIHVGQSDIPPEICRQYLGEKAIVGISARTHDIFSYLQQEDIRPIDYFGVGPLHETATKPDCGLDDTGKIITRSLEDLRRLADESPLPIVVGGGVKQADIPALAATGAAGFFVVSAVAGATYPEMAAAALSDCWQENARP